MIIPSLSLTLIRQREVLMRYKKILTMEKGDGSVFYNIKNRTVP